MKQAIKKGISFGLTSGVITTLGLMVGLNSATSSSRVVVSGILVIAIADALSDALGIHLSEEADNRSSHGEVWEATVYTFLAKFIFASIFILPVLFFPLPTAIVVSVIWGLMLIALASFCIARSQGSKPAKIIGEHLFIAILVIIATEFIGELISKKL